MMLWSPCLKLSQTFGLLRYRSLFLKCIKIFFHISFKKLWLTIDNVLGLSLLIISLHETFLPCFLLFSYNWLLFNFSILQRKCNLGCLHRITQFRQCFIKFLSTLYIYICAVNINVHDVYTTSKFEVSMTKVSRSDEWQDFFLFVVC